MVESSPGASNPADTARILVLVSDPGNRQVLTESLGDAYDLLAAEPSPDVLESESFDCCIVDPACFDRGQDALVEHKVEQRPTILPYLLLEHEEAPPLDPDARECIDDVVVMPTSRRELYRRIESLLRLRGLSLDLTVKNEELLHVNEKLEYLLGAAAHDLRNPLNIAQGHLQLMEGEGDHHRRVDEALVRMEALIENLLTLNRIQREQQVETLEPVDLQPLVADSWDQVATGDAALEIDVPDGWTLLADPVLAQQLLENLFRNAIQHTNEAVVVRVSVRGEGDGFSVADDGPGIPPSDREQVFESGYSTDSGNGLGLPIVQQVADVHGWTVRVSESEDGGARFDMVGVGRPAAKD